MAAARKTAVYLGWKGERVSSQLLGILGESFELLFSGEYGFGDAPDQEKLALLKPDFLFSFGPVIVKRRLLEAVKSAAVNFHTAPPRWPGRGSCSFALYEGDREFGVTAHLMTETVDAGPILRVLTFPVRREDTCETLHRRALECIPVLARETIEDLKKNGWKAMPGKLRWERPALRFRDMARLMEITGEDSEDMVNRKIRAFAHSEKPGPYLKRAGHTFWYLAGKEEGAH